MKILLSNDDGVHAAGLSALQEALSDLGELTVVAPEREQSATSHSVTLHQPLRARKVREGVFAIDGTPTDCVLLAVRGLPGLIQCQPDLVVSGINHGPNLGDDVTYSGTVAAAFEAHLLGIPAVAISFLGEPDRLEAASRTARLMLRQILARDVPRDLLLNVNVPDLPFDELAGFRVVPLGKRVYTDVVVERQDPRGRPYYWIGGQPTWNPDEDTDMTAISAGYVSVTPLHLQLTHAPMLATMGEWELSLSNDEP